MKEINLDIKINKTWDSITGCCCIINTRYLKELITKYSANLLYANNKHEAVCCEIIFGYLIGNLLNIKIKPYYEKSYTYTLKNNTWKVIKKIGGGQGNCQDSVRKIYNFPDYVFDNKLNNINLNCKMDIWNIVMKEIITMIENKVIKLTDLVNENHFKDGYQLSLHCKTKTKCSNLNNILCSIHHYLFVKYFFPNKFLDIMNNYRLKLDSPYAG